MEERQTPDWLAGLSGQTQEEEPPLEESEKRGVVNRLIDSIRGQPHRADIEDLREQIVQPSEGPEKRPGKRFLNLQPWQLFVLSVLLFMEVAVCGGILLLIMGRIMP